MVKGNRYVSMLACSAFEKTKLREGMFNKNHILPGQGKFLPLLSIWPGSHQAGVTDGTSQGKSLQQFRNAEGSLENYVQYFRTCKESSVGQADNRSSRLANRHRQRGRGVRGPEKLLNEVGAWPFLHSSIDHMESKARKQARMATLASHPDGSPPTGGVDYGRKNDLFCTSYCWIVPRCVNKAAGYSNSISGSILAPPLLLP